MDVDEIKKIIKEKWEQLPENIRVVLSKFAWKDVLTAIGKKYKLHIDNLAILENETTMVLLGITNPGNLVNALEEQMKLPEDTVKSMVEDVDSQIFKRIRQQLIGASEEKEDDETEGEGALLSSLENPPTTKPVSFVEAKMQAPHSLKTTSDDDVPLPPETSGVDPYREEF